MLFCGTSYSTIHLNHSTPLKLKMNESDWRSDPKSFIFVVEVVYLVIKWLTGWISSKLGFHGTEIIYGSLAWRYQKWRGYIPLFSWFQSVAASGFSWTAFILLHLGIAFYVQYPFKNVNDGARFLHLLFYCELLLDSLKEVWNSGQFRTWKKLKLSPEPNKIGPNLMYYSYEAGRGFPRTRFVGPVTFSRSGNFV